MPHLTIAQLTDYLLREVDATSSERVADHLSTECEPCNRLLDSIKRVQRVGAADGALQPPAAAVRSVKALCGFNRRLADQLLAAQRDGGAAGRKPRTEPRAGRPALYQTDPAATPYRQQRAKTRPQPP